MNRLFLLLTILGFSFVAFIVAVEEFPNFNGQLAVTINPAGGQAATGNRSQNFSQNQPPKTPQEQLEEIRSSVAPDTILVKLKTGYDISALQQLNSKYGMRETKPLFKRGKTFAQIISQFNARSRRASPDAARKAENIYNDLFQWQKITLNEPNPDKVFAAVAEYKKSDAIEEAQPNYKIKTNFVPNDPYYHSQGSWGQQPTSGDYEDLWGLKRIGLEQAWDVTQGQGVTVAVVDTGLDYTHPDIAQNVWTNTREISGNGIDDDQNSYVDDIRGWDFASGDNDPMDGHGHGTHVSGTIAAVGDNNLGVIGVAPQSKIMPVKGFNDQGNGFIENLAQGIRYAAVNGADVINNSWGCYSACPRNPIAEDAVRLAYGLGAVVVFAAGNSSADVAYFSPGNMSETITVIASRPGDDIRAYFSNFGLVTDVTAPGGGSYGFWAGGLGHNILSLSVPNSWLEQNYVANLVAPGYMRLSGTSMAAPHVSGLSALVIARSRNQNLNFSNEDIRQALRVSADDIAPPGFDINHGAGRINAPRALNRNNVLTAKISSPLTTQLFTPQDGQISITGTVSGPEFREYRLLYGRGSNPSQWTVINNSTNPVSDANGLLGTWDVSNLETDVYTLALSVFSQSGEKFQDAVQVPLENLKFETVTTARTLQSFPHISNNRVVWTDGRRGFWYQDIYLFDLEKNEERRITTDQTVAPDYAAISGDFIVWQDSRNSSDGLEADIYLYNLSTNTEHRLTADGAVPSAPEISGNRVVWQEYRHGIGTDGDIYSCVFDPVTGSCPEEIIATGPMDQFSPNISGNLIVWMESQSQGVVAYVADLNLHRIRRLTSNSATQWFPDVDGSRIVWGSDNGIYTCEYNLITSDCPERLIPGSNLWIGLPRVSRNYIVTLTSNYDLYLYELSSDSVKRVTAEFNQQWPHDVSDNKIVWQDARRWPYFINMYTPTRIVLSPQSRNVRPGETLTFDITIRNNSDVSQTLTGWIDAFGPNGAPYARNPIFGPQTFTLAPGRTVTRTVRQRIPANRPPSGPYTVRAYVGTYPNDWIDSASFQFTIVP